MDTRSATYRGSTREEAEAAYHADARRQAADGYVPTSENWSAALGQQVLTVAFVHDPGQAPAVLSVLSALHSEQAPAPLNSPVPPAPTGGVAPQRTAAGRATAWWRSLGTRARVIVIAVALVVVIAALGSGAEPGTSSASPSPGANSAVTQRPSTPRPTVAAAPTATPAPTLPPTPEPTAAPAFAPITLTGSGSKVAKFTIPEDAAAIATIRSSGSSNFAVWSVAADGSKNDLLVNEIGRYAGTVLFDVSFGEHSVAFEIEASGSWQIVLQPVTAARIWEAGAAGTGTGDDVLVLEVPPSGLVSTTIKHTGTSNFAIWSYSPDGADLLVNEIGAYSGEVIVPSGTYLLAITADGAWSLTSPS